MSIYAYIFIYSGTPIEINTNQTTPIFCYLLYTAKYHSSVRSIGTSAFGTRANTTDRLVIFCVIQGITYICTYIYKYCKSQIGTPLIVSHSLGIKVATF